MDFENPNSFWLEPDFLLTDLVSYMANKLGAQLGVTLMVKGAFLTGTLVGERAYLDAISELFQAMARDTMPPGAKPEDLKAIQEAFDFGALTEDVYPEDEEPEEEEDDMFATQPIRYLHLQDPVIIYPGSTISFSDSPLPIMRIQLNAIDGWMLGRITVMAGDQDGTDAPHDRPSPDRPNADRRRLH